MTWTPPAVRWKTLFLSHVRPVWATSISKLQTIQNRILFFNQTHAQRKPTGFLYLPQKEMPKNKTQDVFKPPKTSVSLHSGWCGWSSWASGCQVRFPQNALQQAPPSRQLQKIGQNADVFLWETLARSFCSTPKNNSTQKKSSNWNPEHHLPTFQPKHDFGGRNFFPAVLTFSRGY